MDAIEALAESWAVIDDKEARFRAGRDAHEWIEACDTFDNYMVEAKRMTWLLEKRGFHVVPLGEDSA